MTLAAPNPIAALGSGGGYVPLVSLFVNGIKLGALPAGWNFIVTSPNEVTEIYLTAWMTLALLLSSPIISYRLMRLIAPVLATRKRTLYSLAAVATLLLAVGAIFGFFVEAKFYLGPLTPSYTFGIFPPVIDAANFYFAVFGAVAVSAVAFTLPAYIYALIRFRRT